MVLTLPQRKSPLYVNGLKSPILNSKSAYLWEFQQNNALKVAEIKDK
jgi:hypothetical protein